MRHISTHIRKFQMLLGMLQWMFTIGRPDLCQLVASLNHFGECPRELQLDLDVQDFGYVKATFNKKNAIDSRPIDFNRLSPKFEKL